MNAWNTNEADNTVSREEAQGLIQDKARDEGITGSFKVYYDGNLVADPSDLPERVDMDKVEVSANMNNASKG